MSDSFEDMLDDTVKEHPIEAFQMFAKVEEGGDYMEPFAELLNAISTNVVVPVEDEDELSDFADMAGQRVFGQIDGEDGIVFSEPGMGDIQNISGEDIDALKDEVEGMSSDYLRFATFPSDFSESEREVYYDDFEKFVKDGAIENIFLNETTRYEVVNESSLISEVANSSVAMNKLVVYKDVMDAISDSEVAMDAISDSEEAMRVISQNDYAVRSLFTYPLDSAASDFLSLDHLFSDEDTMGIVTDSEVAMNTIVNNRTAINAIANNEDAFEKLAESDGGIHAIKNDWNEYSLNDGESPPLSDVYFAEVKGAGGGGASGTSSQTSPGVYDGEDGENSSFGPVEATGGEGGTDWQSSQSDGDDGEYNIDSESAAIVEGIVGGGASGGDGNAPNDGDGGDGGFIQALVYNQEFVEFTASVGDGGEEGRWPSDSGDDGSVSVWIPHWV